MVEPSEDTVETYKKTCASIECLLVTLDSALAEQAEAQLTLGRRHNQRAGINTLPEEILCLIFQYSLHASYLESKWQYDLRCIMPMTLSHICSHWRSIALTCPVLWSRLDLDKLTARTVKVYADRALEHPLDLLYCQPFNVQSHADLVNSKISTIRSIGIIENPHRPDALSNSATTLYLLQEAPVTAPLALETFAWTVSGFRTKKVLDSPLFGGHTPRLRNLAFRGVRLRWKPNFYVNLDTLEITNCDYDYGQVHLQHEDICHVLRDCPNLRKLVLRQTESPQWRAPSTSPTLELQNYRRDNRVPLRHLHHLRLGMPVDYMNHILLSIDAPHVVEFNCTVLPLASEEGTAPLESNLCAKLEDILRSIVPRLDTLSGSMYRDDGQWRCLVDGRLSKSSCSLSASHRHPFRFYWTSLEDGHGRGCISMLCRLFEIMKPFVKPSLSLHVDIIKFQLAFVWTVLKTSRQVIAIHPAVQDTLFDA